MSVVSQYTQIFLNDTPIIDLRAPVEFAQGAFPTATNLPLMNDDEREAVGTRYKQQGQQAAIDLGHELVSGDTKAKRLAQWQAFIDVNPNALLYCFRGGLRSRTTQQWLKDSGYDIPLIEGGYKALRGFLLSHLHRKITDGYIRVLSGPTGSGKTDIIQQVTASIDLEKLANHRGSAFGSTHKNQPAQIDFENQWAIDWLKLDYLGDAPVLFEDESRLIGRIAVLPEFLACSKQAPNIVVQEDFTKRVARIRQDYFELAYQYKLKQTGDQQQALTYLHDFIQFALQRIQKRLGGARYKDLTQLLSDAMHGLVSQNSWSGFDDIVTVLLTDYYDPMYDYQFQAKAERTLFSGSHEEILEWLKCN